MKTCSERSCEQAFLGFQRSRRTIGWLPHGNHSSLPDTRKSRKNYIKTFQLDPCRKFVVIWGDLWEVFGHLVCSCILSGCASQWVECSPRSRQLLKNQNELLHFFSPLVQTESCFGFLY